MVIFQNILKINLKFITGYVSIIITKNDTIGSNCYMFFYYLILSGGVIVMKKWAKYLPVVCQVAAVLSLILAGIAYRKWA